MKPLKAAVLAFLILALAPSCSRTSNPVEPFEPPPRWPMKFATPVAIFEPEDALLPNSDGFHEVDLAELRTGWNYGGPVDSAYSYDGYRAAAVTLQRGAAAGDPFKPVVRFLQGSANGDPETGSQSAVHWVTKWDAESGGTDCAEYRHPKCDAIVFDCGGTTIIEIAVAYQVHGLENDEVAEMVGDDFYGEGFPESNDEEGDWDIGVTVIRWTEANFPGGEPQKRTDFILPDTGFNSQFPDSDPDLAYDRASGDLYVVYSKAETPYGIQKTTARYVWFGREVSAPYDLCPSVILGEGWGDPGNWPRPLAPSGVGDHNGHTPSVAIGLLDFFIHIDDSPSHTWVEDRRWICIAYTSQFYAQVGFHVVAVGWPITIGGYQQRKFLDLRHPDYAPHSAGLP